MTYDQLAAFLAVASTGTFGGASKALHKSQPAVSKLVRNLEDELGLTLFDRSAYRPTLTDAGRLFHERAAAVVEDTEALRSFGQALAGRAEPMVRLVLEAVTPLGPVLRVLAEVQRRFPLVRYELRTERMSGAVEALDDGSADLVVSGSHGMRAVRSRTTEVRRFRTVRILAVAAASHPLAAIRDRLSPRLLRAYPQIVLRESGRGDLPSSVNVLEGGIRWTVTDVTAKREILLAGMGWGGLPEHVVADDLAQGRLVALDVPAFDVEAIELFVLRRRDRPAGIVAQALWDGLDAASDRPGEERSAR